jgi:hypothetical protein
MVECEDPQNVIRFAGHPSSLTRTKSKDDKGVAQTRRLVAVKTDSGQKNLSVSVAS